MIATFMIISQFFSCLVLLSPIFFSWIEAMVSAVHTIFCVLVLHTYGEEERAHFMKVLLLFLCDLDISMYVCIYLPFGGLYKLGKALNISWTLLSSFLICYLAAPRPRPTLCQYRGDSLTNLIVITAFWYLFDP